MCIAEVESSFRVFVSGLVIEVLPTVYCGLDNVMFLDPPLTTALYGLGGDVAFLIRGITSWIQKQRCGLIREWRHILAPHLRLSSQSSDGKGLASRLDLAGSEWKGESESNRPSFFLKAFRRQTSFFLRHPASSKKPPVNITLLDLPTQSGPKQSRTQTPFGASGQPDQL
jgi:hypothetical protein